MQVSPDCHDDCDLNVNSPSAAPITSRINTSHLKGKFHWMLTVSIILGVAPTVFIAALLLELAPCQSGPCWHQLTLGQLTLLTTFIIAAGVHCLLTFSNVSNRYRDSIFPKSEASVSLLSTVVANGNRRVSETSTHENARFCKNVIAESCSYGSRLGMILILFFVCDKSTVLSHVDKHYDRDIFLFLCMLLLFAGIATIKKSHGKDEILNRELTEEWKGWMQIVFLMYHYFDAQEFYAPIRIFVSCYVWMTGFGNFSFFYVKGDFSWYRAATMLWRLNFVTFFLVLSMDTWYQLYYIVQLHTFYFLMVYICMAIKSSGNHSPHTLQVKLVILFVLVFVVWDVPGVFDAIFGFVPPKLLHDWHFRTYLDHYSAPLGMIFAFCFPIFRSWFTAVEKMRPVRQWTVKLAVGLVLAIAVALSMGTVDIFSKPEYNSRHPYQVIFAIMAFVYWRNICPTLRQYSMGAFTYVGKITLESYLAQFHLLLVQDKKGGFCKQILSILPGYPLINAALVTCLFFWVSGQLLDITNRLRSLLIPDDPIVRERLFLRRLVTVVLSAVAVTIYATCAQVLHLGPAQFVTLLLPPIFAIVYFNPDTLSAPPHHHTTKHAAADDPTTSTVLLSTTAGGGVGGGAVGGLGTAAGDDDSCSDAPKPGERLPSVRDALPWAAVGLLLLLPLLFQLPVVFDAAPAKWSGRSLAGHEIPAAAGASNGTLAPAVRAAAASKGAAAASKGAVGAAAAGGFVGCDWVQGIAVLVLAGAMLFTGDAVVIGRTVLELAGGEAPDIASSYRRQEAS